MSKLNKHITLIFTALTLFFALDTHAQSPQKTRILFVLDASQSMLGQWDKEQKMKVATRLLVI